MKLFALIALVLTLLPSCGAPTAEEQPTPSPLQVILVSADYAVGRPRVSFAIFDGPEPAAGISAVTIKALDLDENMNATGAPVWSGPATNYADYQIPYWVVYPELDKDGFWGMVAEITGPDGATSQSNFVIQVRPESQSPSVGEAAPPSENKTLATEPDLSKLSSGNNPDPALYQMTIAEAITSGRPTVVGFLTPGLCQTKWCAPVLDSVEAVRAEVGDAANFIHVEVYDDFQTLQLVKEMGEWGLETEPWVFVLDKDGNIAAKFSGPLSPRELQEALAPLLG